MRYLCIVLLLFTLVFTTSAWSIDNQIKLVLDNGGEYSDGFVEEQWYYVDIPRDYASSYIMFLGNTMGDNPEKIDLLAKSEGSERTFVFENERYYKKGYDFEVKVPVTPGKRILLGVKMKFSDEKAYLFGKVTSLKSERADNKESSNEISEIVDNQGASTDVSDVDSTTKNYDSNSNELLEENLRKQAETDEFTGTYYDSKSGTTKEFKPSEETKEDIYISETASKYNTEDIGSKDEGSSIEISFNLIGNSGTNMIELGKEKVYCKLSIKNTGKYGMWVKLVPYYKGVEATWTKNPVLYFDNRIRVPLKDSGIIAPFVEYNRQYSDILPYEEQLKELYGVIFITPKDTVKYKFSIEPKTVGIMTLGVEVYYTNSNSDSAELPIVSQNGYVGAVPFSKSINKYGHSDETFFLYNLKNRTIYFPEYNAGFHTVSLTRWIDTKSLKKNDYSTDFKVIKPLKNDTGIFDRLSKYIGGE